MCTDATNSSLKDECADYIIIGLVLHRTTPEFQQKILQEARRLLKHNGTLNVLEWEQQSSLFKRIIHSPLLILEQILNRTFNDFFRCNKHDFSNKNGFKVSGTYHCSYSIVTTMTKRNN